MLRRGAGAHNSLFGVHRCDAARRAARRGRGGRAGGGQPGGRRGRGGGGAGEAGAGGLDSGFKPAGHRARPPRRGAPRPAPSRAVTGPPLPASARGHVRPGRLGARACTPGLPVSHLPRRIGFTSLAAAMAASLTQRTNRAARKVQVSIQQHCPAGTHGKEGRPQTASKVHVPWK